MLEVQLGLVDYQASDVGSILQVPPICDAFNPSNTWWERDFKDVTKKVSKNKNSVKIQFLM